MDHRITFSLKGSQVTKGCFILTLVALLAWPTVAFSGTSIEITRQPKDATYKNGATVQISLSAKSSSSLKYQWYKNGRALNGGTSRFLTFRNASKSIEGRYYAKVSNRNHSVKSRTVAITSSEISTPKNTPPPPEKSSSGKTSNTITFTRVPKNVSTSSGKTVQISLSAKGAGTVTYQWYRNGIKIPKGTSRFLTLRNIKSTDAGKYYAMAKDRNGEKATNAVTVKVDGKSGPSSPTAPLQKTKNQIVLHWSHPNKRTDGSRLNQREVKAYRIYHFENGSNKREKVYELNANQTRVKLENLAKGTHTFAMTTVDSKGLESKQTGTIRKTFK